MKKRILAGTIAAITAVGMLTGCGSSSGKYLKDIKASDYVDLCDYNGIAVQEAAPSVTDDYVNMYIQYSLSSSSTYEEVTDHDTVKSGDVVNIDYDGKIDGKEFDGGSSQGYDLTIGSGSFIDGFEDGLIGKKVGEKVSLNLKFPDDYSNADVAGKAVVFDVTINKIEKMTTPELTDEWVAKQNIDGVTTVDAYKAYMKKKLEEQAQQTYDSDVQTQINQYLEKNCTFKKDPPTAMVDRFVSEITTYYTQYAQQYGMDLETFMNYINPADNSSAASSGDASASDSASSGDAAAATSEAAAAATSETAAAAASTADSAAAAATSTETVAAAISAASGSAASGEESSAAATSGSKDYEKTIREQAVRTVKRYIILQAIADKEKLNISNRDYKTQLSSEAADEGYSSVAEFKKNQDAQEFRETLMAQAVMKYLQKQAKITEPDTSDAAASGTSAADASTAASGADASASSTSAAAASSAQDASSAATSNGLGKEENDNAGMGY